MKKLTMIIALGLALCANAATEKLFHAKVADLNGLVRTAAKAGELVGYPMLGSMASMAIAENNPLAKWVGPLRDGEAVSVVFYGDAEKLSAKDEPLDIDDDDDVEFAFLLAPQKSKEEFLASRPGLAEKDGAIEIDMSLDDDDEDYSDDDDDDDDADADEPGEADGGDEADAGNKGYIVFSADGKWACLGSTAEFAKKAVESELDYARQGLGDAFVGFGATKAGMKLVNKSAATALEEQLKAQKGTDEDRKAVKNVVDVLAMIESIESSLALGDAGLDFKCSIKSIEGTELAKLGLTPIEGDGLAFAQPDAVFAYSSAANSGYMGGEPGKQLMELVQLIAKYGLKTDWLAAEDEAASCWRLDLPAAVKYISGEGAEAFGKIDPEKFVAEWRAIGAKMTGFTAEGPASRFAFALAGSNVKLSPSARFARVLGDVSAKKPYRVSVYALYASVKAVLPLMIETGADEEMLPKLKVMVAALPTNEDGAIAAACWRDGADIDFLLRISADEIRGVAAIATNFFTFLMMK